MLLNILQYLLKKQQITLKIQPNLPVFWQKAHIFQKYAPIFRYIASIPSFDIDTFSKNFGV